MNEDGNKRGRVCKEKLRNFICTLVLCLQHQHPLWAPYQFNSSSDPAPCYGLGRQWRLAQALYHVGDQAYDISNKSRGGVRQ